MAGVLIRIPIAMAASIAFFIPRSPFFSSDPPWHTLFGLLPSSIHEWLIIPEDCTVSLEDMKSMVFDANRLVVHEEEVLSDGVYRYSRENDKIEFLGKIEG